MLSYFGTKTAEMQIYKRVKKSINIFIISLAATVLLILIQSLCNIIIKIVEVALVNYLYLFTKEKL